jgi:hypothetical protein
MRESTLVCIINNEGDPLGTNCTKIYPKNCTLRKVPPLNDSRRPLVVSCTLDIALLSSLLFRDFFRDCGRQLNQFQVDMACELTQSI